MINDRLKFILPFWDDIVDPGFNFIKEEHSKEYIRDKFRFGVSLWHLFEEPPLDGILISRSIINPPHSRNNSKYLRIVAEGGIRRFLRISENLTPNRLQIIGDCGAWQYVDEDKPPYDPIDTLEFYNSIGVDYGVTVDHIAVIKDSEKRMEITYNNAVKSFNYWKKKYEKNEYTFVLLGAVQGVEVNDYIRFIEKLYKLGYRYFAIGGLAKRDNRFVGKLINELIKVARNKDIEKIHFLGIARKSLIPLILKLTEYVNDVSFDNATFLRMAWMRTIGNYLSINGNVYTAIRIRMGSKGEREVLDILHKYDLGEVDYNKVIDVLKNYTIINGDTRYLPYYAKTLKDMPWKKCTCNICRTIGIDVVIFRGNDRNRRRGFHNVWVFYNLFKQNMLDIIKSPYTLKDNDLGMPMDNTERFKVFSMIDLKNIKRVLIITSCTKEKNTDWNQVIRVLRQYGLPTPGFDLEKEEEYRKVLSQFIKSARDMYSGTFRYIRRIENILRKNGVKVDVIIVSARYGLITADTPIIPYEATLNSLKADRLREWKKSRDIVNKLRQIISNNNYDLIIVNLPRGYLSAIRELLPKLLGNPKAIIITSSVKLLSVKNFNNVKALVIHAGNIAKRSEVLSLLVRYLEKALNNQKTLNDYIST